MKFISINNASEFYNVHISSDLRIVSGELDVDQSPLTGESLLIQKSDAEGQNEVLPFTIIEYF
jgi:magnesium-transporting ATPase (P-type)